MEVKLLERVDKWVSEEYVFIFSLWDEYAFLLSSWRATAGFYFAIPIFNEGRILVKHTGWFATKPTLLVDFVWNCNDTEAATVFPQTKIPMSYSILC